MGKILVGFSVVLVVFFVMVGWTITVISYLLSWMIYIAIRFIITGAVQEGIKGPYKHDRNRVRQPYNVRRG